MKIIKQGYNECVLATLAMLADKPLYKARAIARNVAEEQEGLSMPWFTWDGYFCCVRYFPETPEGTNKQRWYAQKIIERLNVIGFSPITRSKYEDLKGVRETPPCLAGKGQLSIRIVSELTLREHGHSMAYENWNIYEPDGGTVHKTWQSLRESYQREGWIITRFAVNPLNGGNK